MNKRKNTNMNKRKSEIKSEPDSEKNTISISYALPMKFCLHDSTLNKSVSYNTDYLQKNFPDSISNLLDEMKNCRNNFTLNANYSKYKPLPYDKIDKSFLNEKYGYVYIKEHNIQFNKNIAYIDITMVLNDEIDISDINYDDIEKLIYDSFVFKYRQQYLRISVDIEQVIKPSLFQQFQQLVLRFEPDTICCEAIESPQNISYNIKDAFPFPILK